MRFSCARCGQRYSSVDEPRTGSEYRVPCVACGAVVLLKGADFPALPTAASGPAAAAWADAVYDATGEDPLSLALGPMAAQERAAPSRGGATRTGPRPSAPASHRLLRFAVGSGVVLATAGAALLLVLGGQDARSQSPPPGSPATALPGGGGPSPTAGTSATSPPIAQGAPAPIPGAAGDAPPPKATPSPPPAPLPAPPPKRPVPPTARRVASAPGPGPAGAVNAAPPIPAGASAAAAPPRPSTRPPPDQMVADTLAARRPALEACVREGPQDDPGPGLFGRRVNVSLVVNPSGTVTSCTIDDPALEATALGACLRDVVGRPFPTFEGEPLHVVVPLKLGE